MALRLARDPRGLLTELGAALRDVRDQITPCSVCGVLTEVSRDPCRFCTAAGRDSSLLCVVTNTGSAFRIEDSGAYHGTYHVLAGVLSPQKGQGLQVVNLEALQQRIRTQKVKEVLLALDADTESEATASFLREKLSPMVTVTRPAFGLPAGSGIQYVDALTLARAVEHRI